MADIHYCDDCDCEDCECGCHNVQLAQFESDIIKRESERHAAEIARLREALGRMVGETRYEVVQRLARAALEGE